MDLPPKSSEPPESAVTPGPPGPRVFMVDISEIPFPTIPLPLKVPTCVDYTAMYFEPPKRGRDQALARLLADLEAPKARPRYVALARLGSWGSSTEVDDRLRNHAATELDADLRVQFALVLAMRDTGTTRGTTSWSSTSPG